LLEDACRKQKPELCILALLAFGRQTNRQLIRDSILVGLPTIIASLMSLIPLLILSLFVLAHLAAQL